MRLITNSQKRKIEEELLNILSSTQFELKMLNNDLRSHFGEDIINVKLTNNKYRYSARDRFGSIFDKMLNSMLDISKHVGINERDFRESIEEVIGDNPIYDGEYDMYLSVTPSEEPYLETGIKHWWRPR